MGVDNKGKLVAPTSIFITILVVLGLIGLAAEIGLFIVLLLKQNQEITSKIFESGGIAFIPYSVVKGIEMIIKRITYQQPK